MAAPRRYPPEPPPPRYLPDWYDLVFTADQADVGFYVALARASGGPVLEVGIGSGRIALPIARSGIPVVGIDRSEEMLASLRAKVRREKLGRRVRAELLDMRDFDLGATFPLVIVPFRAFLHNLTTADQIACLEACRRHLAPGGELVLNVFHPSLAYMASNTGANDGLWRWVRDVPQPDGGWVSFSQATRYDTVAQHVHARQRFDRFASNGTRTETYEFPIEIAYLYPGDLHRIFAAAGFDDVAIDGGFQGGPLQSDGDELVVRARASRRSLSRGSGSRSPS
jgi:SAM-dependent methyltransferase